METAFHGFHELFAQLGLDADLESISAFIATHPPMPEISGWEMRCSGRLPRPDCCAKP